MKIHGKTAAEIFDCVRGLIQTGELASGDSLPPVRDLALELGINRNTAAAAYKRLVTSGIAVTQGRLGTTIRNQYARGEQEGATADTPLEDLASGNPNPAWLPDPGEALRIKPYRPRLYGAPTINAVLERDIRDWLAPDCPDHFDVNLTHGAVDAIERLLGLDLRAGDKVAVESPCFLSSINMLRNAGLQPIGVPVDTDGMLADALDDALAKGAQAVILTPRAHNPTSCSLTEKRARAISRVLTKYPNVLVVVDDHFALLSNKHYFSVIPRTANRWALIRSFAKTLGPDLRIAALASDAATSRQLRQRLAAGTGWVSHLLQDIVEATLTSPGARKLIARARDDYTQRRRNLESALHEQGIACIADGDGLNLWVPLAGDDQVAALSLARQGWLVRHGQGFAVHEEVRGLRITISTIEPEQCTRLALHLKRSLGQAG